MPSPLFHFFVMILFSSYHVLGPGCIHDVNFEPRSQINEFDI